MERTDNGQPSTDHRLSLQAFPEPVQIRRAERAIVQPVTSATPLAPNHAAVIGAHRTREASVAQRAEHTAHVDVAESGRMRHFVKAPLPGASNVAAMGEVHASALGESPRYRREIIVGTAA